MGVEKKNQHYNPTTTTTKKTPKNPQSASLFQKVFLLFEMHFPQNASLV